MVIKQDSDVGLKVVAPYKFKAITELDPDALAHASGLHAHPDVLTVNQEDRLSEAQLQDWLEQRFQEGYAEGEKAGYEKAAQAVQPHIRELAALLSELEKQRGVLLEEGERFLVELALKCVAVILGSPAVAERVVSRDKLQEVVQAGLRRFRQNSRFHLKVNPAALEVVRRYLPQILEHMPARVELTVGEHPTLKPGECLLETDLGAVDARLASQFEQLQAILKRQKQDVQPSDD